MKIRNGFVSNSSSTSFCINVKEYKTVFDLAQAMILCREWDNDLELVDKIEEQKSKVDPNSNISFQTCNFNTFIVKKEDQYIVQTCNNHNWGKLKGMNYNFPKPENPKWNYGFGGFEVDTGYERREYYEFHLEEMGEFWFPEYKVWGREIRYNEKQRKCKKHSWSDMVLTREGKTICRECFQEKK